MDTKLVYIRNLMQYTLLNYCEKNPELPRVLFAHIETDSDYAVNLFSGEPGGGQRHFPRIAKPLSKNTPTP